MSVLAFERSGAPTRKAVERRDGGLCARCGMDTEYVKALCRPYLAEACRRQASGDREGSALLRIIVIGFLQDLGFSRAVRVAAIHKWGGAVNVHLWEADHIVPVVHGGGGACGLENLRTLCRACHHRETAQLASVRAKDRRIQRKQQRHAERMAARRAGAQLPLSRRWRR